MHSLPFELTSVSPWRFDDTHTRMKSLLIVPHFGVIAACLCVFSGGVIRVLVYNAAQRKFKQESVLQVSTATFEVREGRTREEAARYCCAAFLVELTANHLSPSV